MSRGVATAAHRFVHWRWINANNGTHLCTSTVLITVWTVLATQNATISFQIKSGGCSSLSSCSRAVQCPQRGPRNPPVSDFSIATFWRVFLLSFGFQVKKGTVRTTRRHAMKGMAGLLLGPLLAHLTPHFTSVRIVRPSVSSGLDAIRFRLKPLPV